MFSDQRLIAVASDLEAPLNTLAKVAIADGLPADLKREADELHARMAQLQTEMSMRALTLYSFRTNGLLGGCYA